MKWLTLNEIKHQLHIEEDFKDEDSRLTGFGESAEDIILQVCNRTYDDFIDKYGGIPSNIREASLLLVTQSYEHRSSGSMQQVYPVPQGFDFLVKPYIRLAINSDASPVQVVTLGSDVKIAFTVDLPDDLKLSDVDFTGKVYNAMKKDVKMDFTKPDCIMIEDGVAYVVLVDTDTLGIGTYLLKVTVHIPDTDYPTGYRKEVININPHVSVRG